MKESKVFHSPLLSMRIGLGDTSLSRFSFVVSKKIDKRATKRNALRRRAYVAFALSPVIKPNLIILFFPKKGCEVLSLPILKQQLEELIKKAGVLLT